MGTRKAIREILDGAAEIWKQPKLSEVALDFYFELLGKFSDAALKKAMQKCVEGNTYFPRPKDIIERLDLKSTGHDQELKSYWTCKVCGNYVHAIVDGKCWECQAGLPLSAGRTPVKRPKEHAEGVGYLMQGALKCQACGEKNVQCIKDPPYSGQWKCRQCYTGLTHEQYRIKIGGILNIMEGRKHGGKETHRVQRVSQSRRRVDKDIKWEVDAGEHGAEASHGGDVEWPSG